MLFVKNLNDFEMQIKISKLQKRTLNLMHFLLCFRKSFYIYLFVISVNNFRIHKKTYNINGTLGAFVAIYLTSTCESFTKVRFQCTF